ncbi:choline kinase [Photobacterium sanctipauli]|uniref:Choline kinase n=1 Tax=Photobacterium sanctipauli TaxID=1342794 RepID=A0A2T3P140_9GAMM|nr:phosphotransferase [Photobacterium sanctipauli]PSW22188.1 choline kinase [Photobacterium sanctipauli]
MTIPAVVLDKIVAELGAQGIERTEVIQPLWGGYGELFRAFLIGSQYRSVIVKHIKLPQPENHPRGWNTSLSHQRKLDSYQVEVNWYRDYANHCDSYCPVPACLYVEQIDNEILLILEDLSTCGFSEVRKEASQAAILACLSWLASFHAKHMGVEPAGLWHTGTYWHLATRPDELAALQDSALKAAAGTIDLALSQCRYQTLVHGDAKLANFCFSADGSKAAAVDFQYVGKGCGMKDVILYLSSVLDFDELVKGDESQQAIDTYLDHYFSELQRGLAAYCPSINADDVEHAWRPLYCVAWADFQRFIKGWSPGHWKINAYTEALTQHALAQLEGKR